MTPQLPLQPARLSDALFDKPVSPAYARRLASNERRRRTWIVIKFAVCVAIIAAYFWESRDTFPRIPGAIERIFGENK